MDGRGKTMSQQLIGVYRGQGFTHFTLDPLDIPLPTVLHKSKSTVEAVKSCFSEVKEPSTDVERHWIILNFDFLVQWQAPLIRRLRQTHPTIPNFVCFTCCTTHDLMNSNLCFFMFYLQIKKCCNIHHHLHV